MTSDKGPEQEHFKANYIEVIKRVVPEFYEETEYQLFGSEEDLQYKVLGKILYAAKNISSLVMVPDTSSSWFGAQHLSSIRYVPYFVPYNELSRCTPAKFEKHVLAPLGKTFGDFPNVGEFSSFLLTSALSSTHLNSVTHSFAQNYSSIVDSNKSSVSAVSNELIDQLGWVYLLNTSGQVIDNASVPPSSLVVSSLTEKLFYGQTLTEADGVSNLFKWLYTNCKGGGSAWTEVCKLYLPSPFNSPSSILYTTNYFMEGGGSGIVSGLPKGFKKAGRAPRTAGRRRSLKYKFTGWSQTRKGLNQPTNTDYFAASSIRQTENRQLFIPAFVPKGFNFSSQQFVDTSGSLSSVYDFNNASGTTFYEFAGSSFFPARAVPDFETNASSFNQLRDVFGSQILRTLTQIFIRRGKEDSRWLRFTNDGFRNFKFGRHVIALYHEYNNKFRRQAQNWVFDSQYVAGNRYSGGFNIVSHVFGPGVFNHNFSHKGKIIDNLSTNAFITSIPQAVSAIHKDWSAIATTVAGGGLNETVVATDGTTRELTEGILQSNAYGTYRNALDIFERPGETYFSNDTLLSGIEILAPAGQNSLAVWNHDDNPSFNVDKISPSGITLIQRSAGSDPRNGIRVRYELGGNKNYSYNGKFEFAPIDYARLDKGLSAITG